MGPRYKPMWLASRPNSIDKAMLASHKGQGAEKPGLVGLTGRPRAPAGSKFPYALPVLHNACAPRCLYSTLPARQPYANASEFSAVQKDSLHQIETPSATSLSRRWNV
jgi:hypothetical protein